MRSVVIGAVVGWFAGACVGLLIEIDGPPVTLERGQAGWAICLTVGAVVGALIGVCLCRDVVVEHVVEGAIKGYGLGFAVFLSWWVLSGGVEV